MYATSRRVAEAAGLAFLIVLTQLVRADDIVLDSGEVIEGKIDWERTKKINEGKKSKRDLVYVVQVDEKGTERQIKMDDVKYVVQKKTSWEERKEAEEWYAKESPKVKETFGAQLDFAKRCISKKLHDKAKTHFDKWYQLKKETVQDTIDAHIALAKECEKYGLFEYARAEYGKAYEIKKKEVDDDTAEGHLKLAQWCEKVKLEDQAIREYEKALVIDPKNASATAAIRRMKESLEYKLKALRQDYEQRGRGWKITVAIEDNVDAKFLEEWKKKIEDLSQYFFELTEGQFFISQCTIEDNTSAGKIIVEKGKLDWEGMNSKQPAGVLAYCKFSGMPQWEVHCPGKVRVSVLAHEMCHGIFGLPDEYYQNPQCDCVMRAAPNPQKLCDSTNHVGGGRRPGPPGSEGKDCWQIILGRYKDVKHPNPDWAWNPSGEQNPGGGFRVEGKRGPGGVLTYQGMKVAQAPKPIIQIVDN